MCFKKETLNNKLFFFVRTRSASITFVLKGQQKKWIPPRAKRADNLCSDYYVFFPVQQPKNSLKPLNFS